MIVQLSHNYDHHSSITEEATDDAVLDQFSGLPKQNFAISSRNEMIMTHSLMVHIKMM